MTETLYMYICFSHDKCPKNKISILLNNDLNKKKQTSF